MARVCLLTPGQLSVSPRVVKEADALTEAGYEVEVFCAHWTAWADETDRMLLKSRRWACTYVGGHPLHNRIPYVWTRLRHRVSRCAIAFVRHSLLQRWALCRVLPELECATRRKPADLYLAHYAGTLPAAVTAAQKYGACAGFDAEDFESSGSGSFAGAVREYVERQYLPQCSYMTVASPGIAEAYSVKYSIPRPVPILNVFPLSLRPKEFRRSKRSGLLTLYWFSQTIGAKRGLEDVIQAMGRLRGLDIELHLRGAWQPGYQQRLFQFAELSGVKPQKIIIHKPASQDEMVRLASEFDVGLALEPGRDRNNDIALSNKIFTYLLAGNAVIATATTAQKPIMESLGEAGFCYQPGDVYTLTQRLEKWFQDRTSLEEARRQAWDVGTWRYNWDLEKKKFLILIEKTLASGKCVL